MNDYDLVEVSSIKLLLLFAFVIMLNGLRQGD